MSRTRGRLLPVLLAATVLVGGANAVAYAANGRPLLLGADNHESRTATVHNRGSGAALSLRTRADAAPLTVSSGRRVLRLNADRVDGVEAAALRTRAWRFRAGGDGDEGPDLVKKFGGLPPGRYLASYNMLVSIIGGADLPVSCWFTTATERRAVFSQATQSAGIVQLSATGYVDTIHGLTFTCHSEAAFSTYPLRVGDPESTVTFTRLDAVTSFYAEVIP